MTTEYQRRMWRYALAAKIPFWAVFLPFEQRLQMHHELVQKRLAKFKIKNKI